MNNENNTQSILDAGMAQGGPQVAKEPIPGESVPYAIVPQNYKLESLERFFEHPLRATGDVVLRDLASFARYLKEQGDEATAIFADPDAKPIQFRAILDYHGADGMPNWKEHRAAYAPKFSESYLAWTRGDRNWMKQLEFAEFLEDHLVDILEPAGAALLEIARELEAKQSCDFRSALNLRNGTVQFSYVEDITSVGGAKGVLEVPSSFRIGLPFHEQGAGQSVCARLKYKIEERRLMFRYELIDMALRLREINGALLAAVAAATRREIYNGTP